jgi:biotin carboxylase
MCKPPYSYGLRQVYPAAFPEATLDEIRRLNERVVRTVGITMGFSHAEMIVTGEGVRIIEIAARGCGVRVATQLLPRMMGIDLLALRLRQALGEAVTFPESSETQAGMFRFFELPEGTIHRIEGISRAAALDGVIHLEFATPLGGRVVTPVDADERPGFVLAVAPTRSEVMALTERAMSLVDIEVA